MPAIKEQEIPFDIPESWAWLRVGEFANMYTGNSIPENIKKNVYEKTKEGFNYIATKDVGFNQAIDYENGVKIPFDERKFKYAYKGTSLLCIEGGSAGRKIGLVKEEIVCFGNKLCSFNPITGDPLYLFYYLQSPIFTGIFKTGISGIIGGVSLNKLKLIPIPLPPLEEQKRIVAKIEELMPYVDQYDIAYSEIERLNKKFPEDLQKSILQYAIQGKLVEQREEDGTAKELYQEIQKEKEKLIKEGKLKKQKALPEIKKDEIPFDIPDSWEWVRLGDIFEINPRSDVSDETSVSFIPMTLIEDGYRSEFTFEIRKWGEVKKGYTHFQEGDIVMAKITPCFQNLKSAVMEDLENGVGAGTTELHVLRYNWGIYSKFYLWFIKSPSFVGKSIKNMTGTAGQKRVPTDIVKNSIAPLPPLEEQKRIVAKIEELMPYTKKLIN